MFTKTMFLSRGLQGKAVDSMATSISEGTAVIDPSRWAASRKESAAVETTDEPDCPQACGDSGGRNEDDCCYALEGGGVAGVGD